MRPEAGRIKLETMDDVRIAEHASVLYYKIRTQRDRHGVVHDVRLAKDESALPITLSHNRTQQIREVLRIVLQNEIELEPLTPQISEEWANRLDGPFEPGPSEPGVISITDMRAQKLAL